jgi:hypothetical protein
MKYEIKKEPCNIVYKNIWVIELDISRYYECLDDYKEYIVEIPCKDENMLKKVLTHVYIILNCNRYSYYRNGNENYYGLTYYDKYIKEAVNKVTGSCGNEYVCNFNLFWYDSDEYKHETIITELDDDMIEEILRPKIAKKLLTKMNYPAEDVNPVLKLKKKDS